MFYFKLLVAQHCSHFIRQLARDRVVGLVLNTKAQEQSLFFSYAQIYFIVKKQKKKYAMLENY